MSLYIYRGGYRLAAPAPRGDVPAFLYMRMRGYTGIRWDSSVTGCLVWLFQNVCFFRVARKE